MFQAVDHVFAELDLAVTYPRRHGTEECRLAIAVVIEHDKALDAQSRGVFGASESAKKLGEKLFKCEALIQTLENPELENGAIVWNADNGWTLTKNAAAMSGLIEVKVIEENQAQEALSSLDDVLALLDEIEG